MKLSLIHPSRNRPQKSVNTIDKWLDRASFQTNIELIISVDEDDPSLELYKQAYQDDELIINKNRSCVDAINAAARFSTGDILIVVSDDTDCLPNWDVLLLKEVEGKTDWILKTVDGIQGYIITAPIMDRVYYNRFVYIYHPEFLHMFCDTYMTCVADITGRKITSNLVFNHLHPGHSGGKELIDDLNKRNDATWAQGENTFIRLMKQFSSEDLKKIKDVSMSNWLRNHGVK